MDAVKSYTKNTDGAAVKILRQITLESAERQLLKIFQSTEP